MREVVVAGAVRTPIGKFGGSLAGLSAADLGASSRELTEKEKDLREIPIAYDGIAVIVNRPFREGALIRQVQRHSLPAWASEIDCANWAQFILKVIVSHPAVTCVIPATTSVAHVRENMGAAYGRLPDEAMRHRMAAYVEKL